MQTLYDGERKNKMGMKELNKEELIKLRKCLASETIDDPEDLFNEIETFIDLIDFWLEHNICIRGIKSFTFNTYLFE